MTIKVWDYSREYEADKKKVLTTIQEVLESGQLILEVVETIIIGFKLSICYFLEKIKIFRDF